MCLAKKKGNKFIHHGNKGFDGGLFLQMYFPFYLLPFKWQVCFISECLMVGHDEIWISHIHVWWNAQIIPLVFWTHDDFTLLQIFFVPPFHILESFIKSCHTVGHERTIWVAYKWLCDVGAFSVLNPDLRQKIHAFSQDAFTQILFIIKSSRNNLFYFPQFATVYKARDRVTDKIYAVKKVCLFDIY